MYLYYLKTTGDTFVIGFNLLYAVFYQVVGDIVIRNFLSFVTKQLLTIPLCACHATHSFAVPLIFSCLLYVL